MHIVLGFLIFMEQKQQKEGDFSTLDASTRFFSEKYAILILKFLKSVHRKP
jgi:hypothetical protein